MLTGDREERNRGKELGGDMQKEVERKREQKSPISIASHARRGQEARGGSGDDGRVTNVWP